MYAGLGSTQHTTVNKSMHRIRLPPAATLGCQARTFVKHSFISRCAPKVMIKGQNDGRTGPTTGTADAAQNDVRKRTRRHNEPVFRCASRQARPPSTSAKKWPWCRDGSPCSPLSVELAEFLTPSRAGETHQKLLHCLQSP